MQIDQTKTHTRSWEHVWYRDINHARHATIVASLLIYSNTWQAKSMLHLCHIIQKLGCKSNVTVKHISHLTFRFRSRNKHFYKCFMLWYQSKNEKAKATCLKHDASYFSYELFNVYIFFIHDWLFQIVFHTLYSVEKAIFMEGKEKSK